MSNRPLPAISPSVGMTRSVSQSTSPRVTPSEETSLAQSLRGVANTTSLPPVGSLSPRQATGFFVDIPPHVEAETRKIRAQLLSPFGKREMDIYVADWVNRESVNTDTLIAVDGKLTRYGVVSLGEFIFIIGPRPTVKEQGPPHIYQRLVNCYSQIGIIYGVGTEMNSRCPASGYASLIRYSRAGPSEHSEYAFSHERLVNRVPYKELAGFYRDENMTAEALWHAGRSIAQFVKDHPGEIPMICSERGLSHPCAVVVSAVMQLYEHDIAQMQSRDATVWNKVFANLRESLCAQRSRHSSLHLPNNAILSENVHRLSSIDSLRSRGVWNNQMLDMVPHVLPQTGLLGEHAIVLQDEHGTIMHRYTADDEQHGASARQAALPEDIYLNHVTVCDGRAADVNTRKALAVEGRMLDPNHYEAGKAGQPWNGKIEVNPDGDCLFRALHRALPTDMRGPGSEDSCISLYRNIIADYFASNIDVLNQFVVKEEADPVWKSVTLGKVQMGHIAFVCESGKGKRTEMISREGVHPGNRNAIRLITQDSTGQFSSDNQFYELSNDSIVGMYRSAILLNNQVTYPSRQNPVVGYINYEGEILDIELLLGTATYIVRSLSAPNSKGGCYCMPVLSMANREISMVTDGDGRVVGGPQHGEQIHIENMEPARNAIFFTPKQKGKSARSLVCYTGADNATREIKYTGFIKKYELNNYHRYEVVPEKNAYVKNPALQLYPPKSAGKIGKFSTSV
ncbi:hypothetical protein RGU70_05520 [Herbaspirillum sp. RTI4]|uniref:hypothetical protein n=1 Tax=Herbaspirillum sp. RTI4 TaxID=3048640 RepID=UPI002AB5746C|nr:hypothetical protein [Herbaspirillum sp. RTI4]MDY7577776.1 hypothetical protein [Herbaspirillum sp. RTI4]MEA9980796.1 hypothetical protein [Herbaspirillum sp. RTI4]